MSRERRYGESRTYEEFVETMHESGYSAREQLAAQRLLMGWMSLELAKYETGYYGPASKDYEDYHEPGD